jgi:hypothetical protein
VGFVVDKVALGQVFSDYILRSPLPIFIPPISSQSPSPIIRGWYNRPVVAAGQKSHPTNKKIIEHIETHTHTRPSNDLNKTRIKKRGIQNISGRAPSAIVRDTIIEL